MVEILTREHAAPFHRISRARFEREVVRVRAAIPELDGVAVALEFRKLGALIGDGHTLVALPHERPRLPIEFYWFEEGLRVVGVSVTQRSLLAARLVAVNDVPATDVAERVRAYIAQGETQWFYCAGMPGLVNNPDVLRAIGRLPCAGLMRSSQPRMSPMDRIGNEGDRTSPPSAGNPSNRELPDRPSRRRRGIAVPYEAAVHEIAFRNQSCGEHQLKR